MFSGPTAFRVPAGDDRFAAGGQGAKLVGDDRPLRNGGLSQLPDRGSRAFSCDGDDGEVPACVHCNSHKPPFGVGRDSSLCQNARRRSTADREAQRLDHSAVLFGRLPPGGKVSADEYRIGRVQAQRLQRAKVYLAAGGYPQLATRVGQPE